MATEEITSTGAAETALIQAALDRASGGGCVRLLPGVHLSGMLRLPGGVTLEIRKGAVLKAVEDPIDN
jgi:polygalacturonase